MSKFKPMLACDVDLSKIKYPVVVQPKIDGVRALNIDGQLVGRSLKKFPSPLVAALCRTELAGFDGELIVGDDPTAPDLCRRTTSVLSSKHAVEGATLRWYVFDFVDRDGYHRHLALGQLMCRLSYQLRVNLRVCAVPCTIVHDEESLLAIEQHFLAEGYEGIIVRKTGSPYKQGRSTAKEGYLLRIKRFVEEEAVVVAISEACTNTNEAKVNELGHTERSSHQAGMVPKGAVGTLHCRDIKTGKDIDVGPGYLTHAEREHYWNNQHELVGKVIKYKHFPHGQKDKPRFPTFVTIRPEEDQ